MKCHSKVMPVGIANRNNEAPPSFLCSCHSSASWQDLTGSELANESRKYSLLGLSPRMVRQYIKEELKLDKAGILEDWWGKCFEVAVPLVPLNCNIKKLTMWPPHRAGPSPSGISYFSTNKLPLTIKHFHRQHQEDLQTPKPKIL